MSGSENSIRMIGRFEAAVWNWRGQGHDDEAGDGKVDGVGREKEDDVAFSNTHGEERGGDGIDGLPGKGEVATGGSIGESELLRYTPSSTKRSEAERCRERSEREEMGKMRKALLSINDIQAPKHGSGMDSYAWIPSSDGQFNIKTAYDYLITCGINSKKGLWKCKIQQRARAFLWSLAHNSIMIEEIRKHRKLSESGIAISVAYTVNLHTL
ncbi:putative ribonuclease H protein At1g65750 family [Senna tora]|uniref:Putative ribonuclease H protein At1g65750 family n=1 Tax=Senna tora TaxID=362788 RepID=A0A835CIM4_9FABA|nr:putative ribonuclease H protein At1g65750 family [Senna tora]